MQAVTAPMFSSAESFSQVTYRFEPELATLHIATRPAPRPCFNEVIGGEMYRVEAQLEAAGGLIEHCGVVHRVEFLLVESAIPGVFGFGGDLDLFVACVRAGADGRRRLLDYGMLCVDGVFRRITKFGCGITTVTVVAGECLGGGFEGALASQLIVAERQARFGLPEVRFGLFPGMGARQLIGMRAGAATAERLIATGETCTADALGPHGLRVVDHVVPTGGGRLQALELIRGLRRRGAAGGKFIGMNTNDASAVGGEAERLMRAEQLYADLVTTVHHWVDAAMALDDASIEHMQRLVARQDRLMARIHSARGGRATLRKTALDAA